jgi:nitrite reductase/ring-hydroxylating ferredoxin subunit
MTTRETFVIAHLHELGDPGSREFSVGAGDWPLRGFVVRKGDDVFAYLNRCPHAGHPLNFKPSYDFLSLDRQFIMCRSHGAVFELANGKCVAGPCVGQALQGFATRVRGSEVILELDAADVARLA